MNIDSTLRLDKDLTNLALGYKEGIDQAAFALAPIISRPGNGQYPSYAKGAWYYKQQNARAAGDPHVNVLEYPVDTWTAYVCEEFPLAAFVDRQNRAKSRVQGMVYSSPEAAAKAVKKALDQSWMYEIIYQVINTTNMVSMYATPAVKWDLDGATPFADLRTWYTAMKDGSGCAPNGMAISDRLLLWLGNSIRAVYGWTQGSNLDVIKNALLMDMGIVADRLFIFRGEYYSSSDSKFLSMLGDVCLLFNTPPRFDDFEPALAASIVPNDSEITTNGFGILAPYNAEHQTGYYIQGVQERKVAFLDQYAGYLGYNCANSF